MTGCAVVALNALMALMKLQRYAPRISVQSLLSGAITERVSRGWHAAMERGIVWMDQMRNRKYV